MHRRKEAKYTGNPFQREKDMAALNRDCAYFGVKAVFNAHDRDLIEFVTPAKFHELGVPAIIAGVKQLRLRCFRP